MVTPNALSLENISHYYGSQCAVQDVTFHVPEKKITAILGKSGSGKSTLLQIINGMIRPSKGNVYFLGQPFDYNHADQLRSHMGYVVQGIGLFPHMTVAENILISMRIQKLEGNSIQRMDTLMEKVNLPASFKTKYPFELSGGEQQRVGICRALLHNPAMLLMDEPLGALDTITRDDIQKEILHLQKTEPRTVVLITHNPHEALTLADYILVLENGKVLQYDTKQNIRDHPINNLVERLITIK